MSLLGALKATVRGRVIAGTSVSNPERWLIRLLNGTGEDDDQPAITESTALALSAVWACVRNIAEDVARLPVAGFETKDDDTRERLPSTEPAVHLLHRRPNPETLPTAFREALMIGALSWGNGIAEIEWAGNGRALALWQQEPGTYTIERDKSERVVYVIKSTRKGGREIALQQDDVFHVKGLSGDGISGISVIQHARNSLALTANAEKFGSGFFGNGAVPTGVLEHPAKLSDGGKRLKDSWKAAHGSGKRSVAVLEEGMKYHPIGLPPEDSQFLETRQFQIPEICRWFRMPPHKIHDLSRSTYSNIEHQAIEYVSDCLLPWIIRVEQEAARKFFHTGLDPNFARTIKLNVASLLRGDIESRYRAYAIGRQWGFLAVDDILTLEDRNPLPGDQGNSYLVPSNMVPADKVDAKIDAEIEGAKRKGTPPAPPPASPENGNQNRGLLQAMLKAQAPVLSEAIDHAGKIASEKLTRNAKRADHTAWLVGFYRDHRDVIRGHVFPFAEAAASLAAAAGYPGREANKIATSIADRAIENLKADHATSADEEIDRTITAIAGATP